MDEEVYKKELRDIDAGIAELEQTIKRLEEDVEETQAALDNARHLNEDFNDFVRVRKRRNDSQVRGGLTKMFSSFIARANDLLTGSQFHDAAGGLEALIVQLTCKLRVQLNDLNYCKCELNMLKESRMQLVTRYMMSISANELEGAE